MTIWTFKCENTNNSILLFLSPEKNEKSIFRGRRAVKKKGSQQRILYCNEFLMSTNMSILCFSAVFQAFPRLYSGFGYWRFRCFRSAFKHVVFISIGLLIAVLLRFRIIPFNC